MIPLIDVMLVLLVIFIVTAPLLTQAVKLELPKATSQPNDLRPRRSSSRSTPPARSTGTARRSRAPSSSSASPPRARSRCSPKSTCAPTRASPTAIVAQTLADASKAGLTKIGFVSEPRSCDPDRMQSEPPMPARRRLDIRSREAGRGQRAHGVAVFQGGRARTARADSAASALFGGAREVQISHGGVLYRLQADRTRKTDPDQVIRLHPILRTSPPPPARAPPKGKAPC